MYSQDARVEVQYLPFAIDCRILVDVHDCIITTVLAGGIVRHYGE
jgi:hypothetical protein